MALAQHAVGEAPIASQFLDSRPPPKPPRKRQYVAKTDHVAAPEAR